MSSCRMPVQACVRVGQCSSVIQIGTPTHPHPPMNVENASDTHFRTPTSARAYPPFPLNLQLQLAASWLEFYLMLTRFNCTG